MSSQAQKTLQLANLLDGDLGACLLLRAPRIFTCGFWSVRRFCPQRVRRQQTEIRMGILAEPAAIGAFAAGQTIYSRIGANQRLRENLGKPPLADAGQPMQEHRMVLPPMPFLKSQPY